MSDFTFKRRWERLVLTIIFSVAICAGAFAQNQPVIGKVIDDVTNEVVPGAVVMVQGTNNGVATDVRGDFKIQAPANAILVIKIIGYETITIPAKFNTLLSIRLKPVNSTLNEVVVVGYGTEKKATLTGSIATVSAKAFKDRGPIDNPLEAMQGTVPGTVITRSSAAPGREGWNLQINGVTSTNGSDPLYIIDGVPVSVPYTTSGAVLSNNSNSNLAASQTAGNALSSLNPDDIESISILKDASAAIYGARGAGGVVLITTKKGKRGKTTLTYDGSVSEKVLGLTPQLATGAQYGEGLAQAVTNDYGGTPPANNLWLRLGQAYTGPYAGSFINLTQYNGQAIAPANNPLNPGFGDVEDLPLFNTNAVSQIYKKSVTSTSHDLSLSGGSDRDDYRVSFGYLYDGSLLRYGQNSNERYNLRASNDFAITDKLKISTTVSLEEDDITIPTQIGIIYQFSQPGLPAFSSNGQPYAWGTQLTPPGELQDGGSNIEDNTRLYTNAQINYSITKNLDLVGVGGYNKSFSNVNTTQNAFTFYNYLGNYAYPATSFSQNNSYDQRQLTTDNYYNTNAYLNYHNTFAQDHNVSLTVGTNFEKDMNNYIMAKTSDLLSSEVPSLNLGIGAANTYTDNESAGQYAIDSYYGRFNYNYKGKYLLEAQGRIDGSSKFDPQDRFKGFYGVSGGWVMTDEDFMKDQKIFNFLKLRASYGQVGNQNGIGLYDYINDLNVVYATGIVNGPPIIGSGTVVQVNPNSSLVSLSRTWETITTSNLGLDFATLNNRLSGTFEYFVKNNNNMLLPQTLPQVLGATPPAANLGHLKTWGWNGQLIWKDKIGEVSYHVGVNLSNANDKLVNYGNQTVIASGYNAAVQGYPINSYFGLKYGGRIQTQAEANAMNAELVGSNIPGASTQVRVGDNSFVDVNGDGKVNSKDYVYLGRDDPNYVGSLTLGFDYKGFDFNTIWQGVGKRTIIRSGNWAVPFGSIYQGQENFWIGKTWTPSNTNAYYPILSSGQNGTTYNTYNYQPSTWFAENGAYLRLKNLVLGYTIPSKKVQSLGISRLRVYLSGTDLLTFDSIKDGWDPEQTRTVAGGNERYPFYKYLTAGVNVTF